MALHNFDCLEPDVSICEALSRELKDTSSCDAVQDDLVIQGRGDHLSLPLRRLPYDEEVAGSCFGDLAVQ